MKNIRLTIAAIVAVAVVIPSCSSGNPEKKQLEGYRNILSAMATSLDGISAQQEIVSTGKSRYGAPLSKDEKKENLEYLVELLSEGRKAIASLEDSIKVCDPEHADEMVKVISFLDRTLSAASQEAEKSGSGSLSAENTAYVFIADEDRLQDLDIKQRRGKVAMQNVHKHLCRKINIDEVAHFTFKGDDPEVLSPHPEDSYYIKETGKDTYTLRIIDKKRFWSYTHFLVIQNDD